MNRIENKEMVADAAKLFQEEVRELTPDISGKELCDMVNDYIYYQTDDMSKEEAHAVVDRTCRMALKYTKGIPEKPATVRTQADAVVIEVRPTVCL